MYVIVTYVSNNTEMLHHAHNVPTTTCHYPAMVVLLEKPLICENSEMVCLNANPGLTSGHGHIIGYGNLALTTCCGHFAALYVASAQQ